MSSGRAEKNWADKITQEVSDGKLPPHRAARKLLYLTGDFKAALAMARKTFRERPRSLEHEEIGNLQLQAGNDFLARNTFLACLMLHGRLHTSNLIHANIPVARAFVDETRKILYIPTSKCASSTIKNYLSYGLTGETHKEAVHRKMLEYYRFVTPTDLATRYADFFKFAVVRDPVERVASYYARNVTTGAIRRSAYGVETFRGLPTMPSAEEFVDRFDDYRRYFLGVRHHTDRQIRYFQDFLDPEAGLQIFGMGGVQTIRARLSDAFGKEIADERFMVTDKKTREKKLDPVWENLRDHYKRDMAVFPSIIAGDGDPSLPYSVETRRAPRTVYFQGLRNAAASLADEAQQENDIIGASTGNVLA